MTRALWFGLIALALIATEAAPARADIPGPYPWSKRPQRPVGPWSSSPAPATGGIAEANPPPVVAPRPAPEPPRRSGPFRSCGSGMGTGFAGIGLAWGMLWFGNRFARTLRSPSGRG